MCYFYQLAFTFLAVIATAVAFLDILFITIFTPESLFFKKMDETCDEVETELKYHKKISWDQIDPFKQLKSVSKDKTLLMGPRL